MNAPIMDSVVVEKDAPVIFFVLDKDTGDVYVSLK